MIKETDPFKKKLTPGEDTCGSGVPGRKHRSTRKNKIKIDTDHDSTMATNINLLMFSICSTNSSLQQKQRFKGLRKNFNLKYFSWFCKTGIYISQRQNLASSECSSHLSHMNRSENLLHFLGRVTVKAGCTYQFCINL